MGSGGVILGVVSGSLHVSLNEAVDEGVVAEATLFLGSLKCLGRQGAKLNAVHGCIGANWNLLR